MHHFFSDEVGSDEGGGGGGSGWGGGAVGWCFRLGDLVQVGMFQVIKWGEGCVHVGEGWWVHVRGGGECSGGGVQAGVFRGVQW